MIDEQLARLRTHRNNIARYRRLLKTKLTDIERQFIVRRLSEEQSALERLAEIAFPDPGDPYSGIIRLGHLRNSQPNGGGFKPDDVCRLMEMSFGLITLAKTLSFLGMLAESLTSYCSA